MAEKSPFYHKLAHVGVVVRDMDKAVKRLEGLGIGPFKPISLSPVVGEIVFRGKPIKQLPGNKQTIAKIGDVEIELLEPTEGDSPWREYLDSIGEGIHHLAFAVDDPFKEADKLVKQGANLLLTAKAESGGGVYLDLEVGGIIISMFK